MVITTSSGFGVCLFVCLTGDLQQVCDSCPASGGTPRALAATGVLGFLQPRLNGHKMKSVACEMSGVLNSYWSKSSSNQGRGVDAANSSYIPACGGCLWCSSWHLRLGTSGSFLPKTSQGFQWKTEKQYCLLACFWPCSWTSKKTPGLVVVEKLLGCCRDWTRSSGWLRGSVDNSLPHLCGREKIYHSEGQKTQLVNSLFLPHLWQHFFL